MIKYIGGFLPVYLRWWPGGFRSMILCCSLVCYYMVSVIRSIQLIACLPCSSRPTRRYAGITLTSQTPHQEKNNIPPDDDARIMSCIITIAHKRVGYIWKSRKITRKKKTSIQIEDDGCKKAFMGFHGET